MTYYKTSNLSVARQKGKITLSLAIIFGLVLLSIIYLAEINSIVARNFELRVVQNYLEEQEDKNQEILISLMQARSLNNLESAAKNFNLVAVEKINYLKMVSGFFALSQQP